MKTFFSAIILVSASAFAYELNANEALVQTVSAGE